MIKFNLNIAVLAILIILLIGQPPLQAAFFSPVLENFIKDGKEVSILLSEGEKELEIVPLNNIRLYRADTNGYVNLEEGRLYSFKLERLKREFYNIQVFATADKEKANQISLELSQRGYQFVKIIEEDQLFKIRLGNYKEEGDYLPVIEELNELGWDTWPVKEIEELTEKIYVYDNNERLFQGSRIYFSGSYNFNGGIYSGKTYLKTISSGIDLINVTGINNLLGGIMETVFQGTEQGLEEETLSEIMKSYSIALRTNILSYFFNNEVMENSLYKGITNNEKILETLRLTEGMVLGEKKENREIEIHSLINVELFTYIQRALMGNNYLDILKDLFARKTLLDLKNMSVERLLVDAEVKWGLKYKEIRYIDWQGPIVYTVLDLDLNRRRLYFQPVLANGKIPGLESLESIVERNGALAGINGGYFDYTRPLGLIYIDRTLVSEPVKDRTALLLTEENDIIFERVSWQGYLETENNIEQFHGVNRKPGNNQITIFNKYYGTQAPQIKAGMLELVVEDNRIKEINYFIDNYNNTNGSTIPDHGYIIQAHGTACQDLVNFNIGDHIYLRDVFTPDITEYKVKIAISAGPRLIKDGQIFINSLEEEFQADIAYGRAPRSAVGLTADNRLVFFTVDGRQPGYSIGITLNQMAEFMKNYGIVDGMNLDGGHSASMVVRGFTMNNPGVERLISNAIIIGADEL